MEGQVTRRRVVAVALALLVVAGACTSSSQPKVVVGARTPSFRVLYRVTHSAGAGQAQVVWQVLTVKRPFLASDLSFAQRPDLANLGQPQNGTLTDVDHLYERDGATLRAIGRQPGIGTGDQALLSVANDAAARQLVRIKDTQTVNGRKCTRLVFSEQPVGGLTAFKDDKNHDDICIDRGGVVLREEWTLNGRVVERREAVAFAEATDDAFDTSNAEEIGGGVAVPRVQPIEAGLTPPPTPKDYDPAAAVDFFLPRADAPSELAYASKVWAFAKGGDEITVELGAGQVQPWNAADDKPLRIGSRAAASLVRSDGIEIHWTDGDHWIRVRGSLALAALLPYARVVSNWDSSAAAAVPR